MEMRQAQIVVDHVLDAQLVVTVSLETIVREALAKVEYVLVRTILKIHVLKCI